jgi:hypothetical protein
MNSTRRPTNFAAVILFLACGLVYSQPGEIAATEKVPSVALLPRLAYSSCASCGNCHVKGYEEHRQSMHSRSFSNPVFLAQYRGDVLPTAYSSADAFSQARSCTACHAPVAHKLARARVVEPDPSTRDVSGVTCDFCHTISSYHGEQPGNGNYHSEPGDTKFGPFQTRTDWHHEYSALQTRSEFCAICHSVRNQHGLDVKSTYAEWQSSRHAREGIQCQDCHMSVNGFLTEGRAVHGSGLAAVMTLGSAPVRDTLYTHRFQGARTHSQIEGAIQMAFQLPAEPIQSGGEFNITLLVDNSRTGHKMPSGSVELRYLWLDVAAECGGTRIHLSPSTPPERDGYAITGVHEETDRDILGGAVPPGHRIYRTLLADRRGKPTLAFYEARGIIFDNRLNASEVRSENYRLKVPATSARSMVLCAHLYYVAYPDSFAQRLALAKAVPVEIASARTEVSVDPR